MTYKEFKTYTENEGVTDDTKLGYRDMNFGQKGRDRDIDDLSISTTELLFSSIYWGYLD